ncbi:MAG: helix-turn-helix domain-containing protein [Flavobacteriales bacterium]
MKNATILHEVTPEHINALFEGLQAQLIELKQNFEPKSPAEYLTREEVSKMLDCDLSTVHNWTKSGKLIAYGIGHRVYYKRSEVEDALVRLNK